MDTTMLKRYANHKEKAKDPIANPASAVAPAARRVGAPTDAGVSTTVDPKSNSPKSSKDIIPQNNLSQIKGETPNYQD